MAMKNRFLILIIWSVVLCSLPATAKKSQTSDNKVNAFQHDSVAARHMKVVTDYQNVFDKYPRTDINGQPCVLLKVITTQKDSISFSGSIVGEIEYRDFAHWLYLPEGTRLLHINSGSRDMDLDLNRMAEGLTSGLQGGVSYSLCGLDNDDTIALNPMLDYYAAKDSKRIRDFVRDYLNSFNNRDLEKFIRYYGSNTGLFCGNRVAFEQMINDVRANNDNGYYVRLDFADLHGTKPQIYGLNVRFYDLNDNTLGYSFLLLDLHEPEIIQNHVTTFQTDEDMRKDGPYTFEDFFIP